MFGLQGLLLCGLGLHNWQYVGVKDDILAMGRVCTRNIDHSEQLVQDWEGTELKEGWMRSTGGNRG